jgi:hypothetical protein
MTTHPSPTLLRRSLLLDGAISGATALLLFLGSGGLGALLGIPPDVMRYAGLALLPFAAAVLYLAMREDVPRPAVVAVIVLNALWVAGSVLLVVGGWLALTTAGIGFVLFQAAVVAGFVELQYVGLRRAPGAPSHG